MPKISNRGVAMPSSPIRKLVPFADAAKKAGKHIFHLNIGQPDIQTPPELLNAVKQNNIEVLAYIHSEGGLSYRQKLSEYYHNLGAKQIQPEDIVVTTGGSEALLFSLFAILDPGDEIIVPEPFYANYNGFSNAGNISIKTITAHINNGYALPAAEAFNELISEKTKAILICNPSNPTGYLYSKEELEALREICLRNDLFLIVDEVYREFIYGRSEHFSVLNLPDFADNAVVIDSISKRYSACGARLGNVVSKNKELMSTILKFAQSRLSPPTYSEIAAEAALNVPSSYFDSVVQEYTERRDLLVQGLNAIEGVKCPKPQGAFYVFCELPVNDTDAFCRWMLESFEFEGNTVMMAPGSGFYSTEGLGKKEVRIAYVLNKDDLSKALVCLERGLAKYNNNQF